MASYTTQNSFAAVQTIRTVFNPVSRGLEYRQEISPSAAARQLNRNGGYIKWRKGLGNAGFGRFEGLVRRRLGGGLT